MRTSTWWERAQAVVLFPIVALGVAYALCHFWLSRRRLDALARKANRELRHAGQWVPPSLPGPARPAPLRPIDRRRS